MKKQLTVALGLAVLATPAFATKARLQALGEDTYGSQYINDNRNIWLNAAQINNHKDVVTYEFGGNTTVDNAETARGEGGVYKAMGNMVYGVHFGGASNTGNQLRTAAGLVSVDGTSIDDATATSNGNEENNVDLFIGGDAGLKWGANLGYARTQGDENSGVYAESMRTRFGVIMGDLQLYGNINLINNAKGEIFAESAVTGAPVDIEGSAKFQGKLGYQVGAIQAWQGNTLFVDFRSFDMESTIRTGAPTNINAKEDLSSKQLEAGIGRVERLNDKTNLFLKASYFQRNLENDHGKQGGTLGAGCALSVGFCESYSTKRVPVVIGMETEATSWLTLRASVSQVVWGTQETEDAGDKTESGIRNTTAINAGATLKFGELSVDGVIGNSTNTGVAGSGAESNTTAAGNGTLRLDNLMSRVSMTYRF